MSADQSKLKNETQRVLLTSVPFHSKSQRKRKHSNERIFLDPSTANVSETMSSQD